MQCTSWIFMCFIVLNMLHWIFMCFIVVVHWMLANLASNHSQTIVIVGRPLSVLITVLIHHSLLDFKPNMLYSVLDSPQSLAMFCRKIRLNKSMKFHSVFQGTAAAFHSLQKFWVTAMVSLHGGPRWSSNTAEKPSCNRRNGKKHLQLVASLDCWRILPSIFLITHDIPKETFQGFSNLFLGG